MIELLQRFRVLLFKGLMTCPLRPTCMFSNQALAFMPPDVSVAVQFNFCVLSSVVSLHRGIPNYDFKIGRITFIRNSKPQPKKFVDDVRIVMFVALECSNILCRSVLLGYVISFALRTML